jgi:hypothetical protein
MACTDPSKLDITFIRGIDFVATQYQLCDANGQGIDYTGYTIDADARRTPDAALAFSMGVSWVDASTGTYQIAKTDTDTTALATGEYGYDVVLTTPAPASLRLPPVFSAKVKVVNNYTQS